MREGRLTAVPIATADGLRGTFRSIHWMPLLVVPAAASLGLLASHALTGGSDNRIALVGELGMAATAVAPAFIVDDAIREAAPATPVDALARLVARAAMAVPASVACWLLVFALYHSVASQDGTKAFAELAWAGLSLATAAMGFAAVGGRSRPLGSPGTVGVAAMACLGAASMAFPAAVDAMWPGDVLCPAVIPMSFTAIALATREPLP